MGRKPGEDIDALYRRQAETFRRWRSCTGQDVPALVEHPKPSGANESNSANAASRFSFEEYSPERIAARQANGESTLLPSSDGPPLNAQATAGVGMSAAASRPAESGGPVLTPRSKALMKVSDDFKAGKISKEEKQVYRLWYCCCYLLPFAHTPTHKPHPTNRRCKGSKFSTVEVRR